MSPQPKEIRSSLDAFSHATGGLEQISVREQTGLPVVRIELRHTVPYVGKRGGGTTTTTPL